MEGEVGERLNAEPSRRLCGVLAQRSAEAVLAEDLHVVQVTESQGRRCLLELGPRNLPAERPAYPAESLTLVL